MSDKGPTRYKLDHAFEVEEKIQAIAAIARKGGQLKDFASLMKKALELLHNDPCGWGDPEFHSKSVEGTDYHSLLRPVSFRYVVYEQVRSVVLLNIRLYADFK